MESTLTKNLPLKGGGALDESKSITKTMPQYCEYQLSRDLLSRLDKYIDSEAWWSHAKDINCTTVIREALESFLADGWAPFT
jgi:hypothetical protein